MRLVAAAALLLVFPRHAGAEVLLQEVRWSLTGGGKGVKPEYAELKEWAQPASPRLKTKPAALVTLLNRGPKPADGVLLRYAVSARLARIGESGSGGVWTVPFWIEERRVPRIPANQSRRVVIRSMLLATHLKRVYAAGFWPDALKIQLMLEPRPGEGLDGRVQENVLPVVGAVPP